MASESDTYLTKDNIMHYQCLVVGASGVGKSSFIFRASNGFFPATGAALDKGGVAFKTIKGWVAFHLHELPAKDGFKIEKRPCFKDRDCALILFDLQDKKTYHKSIVSWYDKLIISSKEFLQNKKTCQCAIVVVGTKDDVEGSESHPKMKTVDIARDHWNRDMEFARVSSKTSPPWEICRPFLELARELLEDDKLVFMPVSKEEAFQFNKDGRVF